MSNRSGLTRSQPAAVGHDYRLEPPDHIIAELQSSVVRCRQARERTRDELVDDLVAAARELAEGRDPHAAVGLAALAILLRMAAAA